MVEGFGDVARVRCYRPIFCRLLPLAIGFWLCGLLLLTSGAADSTPASSELETCDKPEALFPDSGIPERAAWESADKRASIVLKLERLQRLMERFPSTLWAKRAGLLSGVLSIERNPGVAIQFLRASTARFSCLG